MRICSDQPCIVLLTEKDVWIRVNGKEPISLKANHMAGNDSNLLIVFYVQIMPDDFVMQLHR
ncbi:hypothetical protein U4X50_20465, partial [Escherichia coli]|nr:hypothetical protein [Escherichia coli]